MIVKITCQVILSKEYRTTNLGSVLHGVLMEKIPTQLAEQLHQLSAYSPLRQRLYFEGGKNIWEIVSFSDPLSDELVAVLLKNAQFYLKRHQTYIQLTDVTVKRIEDRELIESCFSNQESDRIAVLNLHTPMSFKAQGTYDVLPDLRKFFRSSMRTFDTFFPSYHLEDPETLDYILEHVRISDYNLRSTRFSLEGVRIPAFIGSIKLRIAGPLPIRQLVWLLLRFGEFSGLGIKTSLGMGKYSIKLPHKSPEQKFFSEKNNRIEK